MTENCILLINAELTLLIFKSTPGAFNRSKKNDASFPSLIWLFKSSLVFNYAFFKNRAEIYSSLMRLIRQLGLN